MGTRDLILPSIQGADPHLVPLALGEHARELPKSLLCQQQMGCCNLGSTGPILPEWPYKINILLRVILLNCFPETSIFGCKFIQLRVACLILRKWCGGIHASLQVTSAALEAFCSCCFLELTFYLFIYLLKIDCMAFRSFPCRCRKNLFFFFFSTALWEEKPCSLPWIISMLPGHTLMMVSPEPCRSTTG